jgi:adenosylcobinamide kinase/adenosylcobinamide-phosphate guanylyltransferase
MTTVFSSYTTALVLGGCRSGKSRHAQEMAEAAAERRIYVATCIPRDPEMHERVRRHQRDRDDTWKTIECPRDLAGVIRSQSGEGVALLVDCLTLWVTNLLMDMDSGLSFDSCLDALTAAITDATGPIILVSNEVGQGIVPDNALARQFRDLAGMTHQRVAAAVDRVVLMVAGIPLTVKPTPETGDRL